MIEEKRKKERESEKKMEKSVNSAQKDFRQHNFHTDFFLSIELVYPIADG